MSFGNGLENVCSDFLSSEFDECGNWHVLESNNQHWVSMLDGSPFPLIERRPVFQHCIGCLWV